MRYLLAIVLTAFVVGGGVYYWQTELQPPSGAGEPVGGPGGFGGGGGFGGRAQTLPLVGVTPAGYDTIYDTVQAIGTAQANESLTVTAKVTDTVRAVDFDDGDFVEAGDVLVQLTNREEEALLAEARANLDDAELQLARVENLAQQNLIPASELDTARSRAEASQARLDTVLARLSDRLILAPFSGVLGFRQVSPGTLLQPNTPITTLDDISTIKLDFTVPETFLGALAPGSRVFAESASYPNREFEGEVRTVGSRVDPERSRSLGVTPTTVANAVEFAWLYRKSTALYDMELRWRPMFPMAAAGAAAVLVTQPLPAGQFAWFLVRLVVYVLLVIVIARLPLWRPDEREMLRAAVMSLVRRRRGGP